MQGELWKHQYIIKVFKMHIPFLRDTGFEGWFSTHFQNYSLFAFSMTLLRFFGHEAAVMPLWPYNSKPLSIMSKRIYRFSTFYNRFIKSTLHSYLHARPCPSASYELPLYFHTHAHTHTRCTLTQTLVIYQLLRLPLIASVPDLCLSPLESS